MKKLSSYFLYGGLASVGVLAMSFSFSKFAKKNILIQQIDSSFDALNHNLTLYQYASCPFCSKVRAGLNYYGFKYNIVEVNPVSKKELKFSHDYKKVPILLVEKDGAKITLKDSSVILSVLYTYLISKKLKISDIIEYYPLKESIEDGKAKKVFENAHNIMYFDAQKVPSDIAITNEQKWRQWVDAHFVHLISPNVYRTFVESYKTFFQFSKNGKWNEVFTFFERFMVINIGSIIMYIISKSLKKKYKLDKDVRISLYQACDLWMNEINKKGTTFMGGSQPSLSDISLYGMFTSFKHTPAYYDCLSNTNIGNWLNEVEKCVNKRSGSSLIESKSNNL